MRTLIERYVPQGLFVLLFSALVAFHPAAYGQGYAKPAYTQQELDQMLAPIALYPDPLLSQILMASIYPREVVEAARWSRAHRGIHGDQAVWAVADKGWNPSVKSLVAFPQILAMMDQKLDWTERLGEAFLAQEPQVMSAVQGLRQRAYAAGNLRSNEHVRVESQGRVIAIKPASPQLVYMPYYDPLMVYGPWWWPAHPPVYWAPWPGYHVRPGSQTTRNVNVAPGARAAESGLSNRGGSAHRPQLSGETTVRRTDHPAVGKQNARPAQIATGRPSAPPAQPAVERQPRAPVPPPQANAPAPRQPAPQASANAPAQRSSSNDRGEPHSAKPRDHGRKPDDKK